MWLRAGGVLSRRLLAGLTVGGFAFGVVVAAGYAWHWAWTGFAGHTFRDWLYLLIEPFVLPMVCRWFLSNQGQLGAPARDAPTG